MDAPGFAANTLEPVWLVWFAATGALAARVVRRELWPHPERRRVLWLVAVACAGVFVATLLLPLRVDSSGLLELSDGRTPWKGAAGEAVVRLLGWLWPPTHLGIIHASRLWILPGGLLAVAVASTVPFGAARPRSLVLGLDSYLLLAAGSLVMAPSFLFGVLGVFNFWFFSVVTLTLLLAWQDLVRSPTWAGRLALVSSILLVGFARPETIAGGILLAALAAGYGARRRDAGLLALSAVALTLLLVSAPSVVAYLGDRMRNEPLLMGRDAAGSAPAWKLPWIATRRFVQHAPVNLAALLVALNAVLLLAATRAARIVRRRQASWPEVAALALLLAELLAIGVHREGFLRYDKYGQLVVVPAWFLAMAALAAEPGDRRRRAWHAFVIGGASAAFLAATLFEASGRGRCSLVPGRCFSARVADQRLLWATVPRWSASLCAGPDSRDRVRVVVVGLDERVSRGGAAPEEMFAPPICEPERWPVRHLLERAGCAAAGAYPDDRTPVRAALFDADRGALCRPLEFGGAPGGPLPATHAIVTSYRAGRAAEIRAALAEDPRCPWQVVEETPSAMLLGRVTSPRRPTRRRRARWRAAPPRPASGRPTAHRRPPGRRAVAGSRRPPGSRRS